MNFPTFTSALFVFLVCLFFSDASAQTRSWGYNSTGQLGIGSSSNYQPNPQIVTSVPDATAIDGGEWHTVFLKADGTVVASGLGGLIGDGTTTARLTPVTVLTLTNITAVSAGGRHSLALKSDGTVWAWGGTSYGEIGNGTQSSSLTPVQSGAAVPGFNNIVAVAAGWGHSLALKADGTVWAWGRNSQGQLGNGTVGTNRFFPEQISTLSNVIAIQAGDSHNLVLKSDGTVWVWGWNASAQLGNGTVGPAGCQCVGTPAQAPVTGVSQIAAGAHHNVVLKLDGSVYVWGRNYGAAGDGSTTDIAYYPRLSRVTNVIDIAAGYDTTFVRKRDGSVWAWGRNSIGQLGIGTSQSPMPLPVQTNVGTGNVFISAGYEHGHTGIPSIATLAGSNVRLVGGNVNITFASVTAEGTTQYSAVDPSTFAPPAGFDIVDNSRAYNLTTTAAFTSATVCLKVPTTYSETRFNTLSILHQENGNFVDRTVSRNFQRREICASVTNFSPFVLALPARAAPSASKFDFDGDGRADPSFFRPSNRVWHLLLTTQEVTTTVQFGISTDKITPADFDGDGRTDISVYRDGVWYWLNSSNGSFNARQFGLGSDIPVPADYTGDGRAELAVYRAGFWYLLDLANNQFNAIQFGISTDKPVPADFDGDGKIDIAVYRDGVWYLLRSSQGFAAVQFGIASDKLVVGDYDGDWKADPAVYRNGVWYILGSTQGFYAVHFGVATDVPAAADYDSDGRADVAVFRNGDWYLFGSLPLAGFQFGVATDRPIPTAFVP